MPCSAILALQNAMDKFAGCTIPNPDLPNQTFHPQTGLLNPQNIGKRLGKPCGNSNHMPRSSLFGSRQHSPSLQIRPTNEPGVVLTNPAGAPRASFPETGGSQTVSPTPNNNAICPASQNAAFLLPLPNLTGELGHRKYWEVPTYIQPKSCGKNNTKRLA